MRARATLLGDVGPSAPDQWEFDEPHVLVSVYAADAARLEETLGSVLVPDTQDGVELLHVQRAHELPGGKDHFGFFDGVSQPAIQGSGVLSRPGDGIRHGEHGWREVATGEVLLGYPDEDGTLPKAPHAPYDRNGTYVVLRKLAVDTAAFRRFVAEADYPGGPELLAAKIVGRWPDGTPLALAPDGPDEALAGDPSRINDFGYADDPQGLRCPLGSHIRRANPRDAPSFFGGRLSARHRIVRRGRAYGDPLPPGVMDDDGADRGLVFVSFQSNLWRQFETIQAQWINDGDRFGLGRDTDPLVGEPHPGGTKLTVPGTPPYFVTARPRLVTMRGGAYLFQPSMTALRHLAAGFRADRLGLREPARQPVELRPVVRAEQGDVGPAGVQLPQPGEVVAAEPVDHRLGHLEGHQTGRGTDGRRDVALVEVRVAGVQDPAVGTADRHARVAAGVPDQGHQQDVVGQHRDGLEALPGLALDVVGLPPRDVGPVRGEVAEPLAEHRVHGRVVLGPPDVHRRVREVGQAAGVVRVEVGQHDVGDVAGREPQRRHLRRRRLGRVEDRADQEHERPAQPGGALLDVGDPDAGVHEREPVGPLDEQAVGDQVAGHHGGQLTTQGPHRPAVEVVHPRDRHDRCRLAVSRTSAFCQRANGDASAIASRVGTSGHEDPTREAPS